MVERIIEDNVKSIEESLDQLIPLSDSPRKSLYEGARYLLFAPSKRIRPLFTLAVTSLFNCKREKSLFPACALELIHTYSLIHDDLPCMDDDDFRRGKPALHKVYDEATALLIGDYLLTYAFEVLSIAPHISADQKIQLINCLSKNSGGEWLIGGQYMDLQSNASHEEVNRRKTGALFVASFQFGGIIASASNADMQKLTHLGEKVGLLFQLVDDLLDNEHSHPEEGRQEAISLFKEASHIFPSDQITFLLQKIIDQLLIHF